MTIKHLIILVFLPLIFVKAQFNEKKISIGINGVYTTTAKIYFNPNSSDPVLRNNAFEISDIYNVAVDIRYRITDDIIIGIGTEYMKTSAPGPNLTAFLGNSTISINTNDGFLLIPVEVSGYYILPFSTDRFKFLMGGGAGIYFGKQTREFGDASVYTVNRDFSYGIQVSVSADYLIRDNLTVHSEMKFRDPQFKVKSGYDKLEVNYNNENIVLAQRTFDSKIDVNGVTFILGFSFLF